MSKDNFDTTKSDAQATAVYPITPDKFELNKYAEYEQALNERCKQFWNSDSGVLVYRRMRVGEVFSYGYRDMKKSLAWQLGALQKSMNYKADVPNFLEPWYGIGTAASAYGIDYLWEEGQAPAVKPKFTNTAEALKYQTTSIAETPIGKQTLAMIEYFLDKTKGKLPVSFCDIQSPLNAGGNIVDISNFMMDFFMDTDAVTRFLNHLTARIAEFTKTQQDMIGSCLASPGHGFASSRAFQGFGLSDDNIVMLSEDLYTQFAVPAMKKIGDQFGGRAFHSCGNWSDKIPAVKGIEGLKMADGAFSFQTDPAPNPPETFAGAFANTGIVLNARIVGGMEKIKNTVKKLWKPGMKLIVVTYCQTPKEQEKVYDAVHAICC